ncbi:MAG: hypothetical protein QOH06_1416, partial [Acidobacteriota bacterium]|nr:hypothetical protein [Acidobacteriota bacterium]
RSGGGLGRGSSSGGTPLAGGGLSLGALASRRHPQDIGPKARPSYRLRRHSPSGDKPRVPRRSRSHRRRSRSPRGRSLSPRGNSHAPGGDCLLPHGDGHLPRGDGHSPRGDGHSPRGDGHSPHGDGRLPRGDGRLPHGDGRLPHGDSHSPCGDSHSRRASAKLPGSSGCRKTPSPALPRCAGEGAGGLRVRRHSYSVTSP